ncbi:MAG: LURP-one-related family protein [Lachnospiraceae bacterium]|nr:LURP-one-related family protein [Lachnospiraceae bacterium]
MKNDDMSGFKEYKNTQGYTIEGLFEVLEKVEVSFGKPTMGSMYKNPAIVYPLEKGRMDIYIYLHKDKIMLARALKQNKSIGKEVFKELALGLALNAHDADDTQLSEVYVEELDGIMKQIMEGRTEGIESNAANAASGETLDFFMRQKITLIKDKYSIFDENENVSYYVQGNLLGLNFSITDSIGSEIFTIQKKLVAVTPEYSLKSAGREIGHIKKKITLLKDDIRGTINGQELIIKGNISGYAFTIELNGKVVGSVAAKRLTLGDCYNIKVMDPSLKDIVVAIAVICDNSIKNRDSKL